MASDFVRKFMAGFLCVLCFVGYAFGGDARMGTHYPTVYGKVGEALKNPDTGLDFVDIDWADIDNFAGEEFGESSFTVDKTTLPKWLKWEGVTTTKDKSKRVERYPSAGGPGWWYADGGKYYPISGTPTEGGTWNVKVSARWSDGVTETVTIQIIVKAVPTITYDANGGKIGAQAKVTLPCAEEDEDTYTYVFPPTPANAKGEFDGWWTAKEGGVSVAPGDEVDFSVFANPAAPTLYAQWRMARKLTVVGGFLEDGTTTMGDLYRGDNIGAYIDESKLYDKNGNRVNEFAYWSYTPATVDLGPDFCNRWPEIDVAMPNADVKLTANYVNGFAAYIETACFTVGEGDEGDFYWSMDNGKTLFRFDEAFPVKAGKVTLKFYDKNGIWRAADVTRTIPARDEEGPSSWAVEAKFVPVEGSTKVKFDANGGDGTYEDYFLEGLPYGSYNFATRKGNAFAGWWTEKTGGQLITRETLFDLSLFAGQNTPTLYAHWLPFKKLTLKDDSASAYYEIYSDELDPDLEVSEEIFYCIESSNPELTEYGGYLEGKGVLEVLPGVTVELGVESTAEDRNGNELVFQKWTVTPSKANLGPNFMAVDNNTEFTMPAEDVTFQATYIDEDTCGYLNASVFADSIDVYGGDEEVVIEPPYAAFEWSPDGGKTWYKAGCYSSGYMEDDGEGGFYWVEGGWENGLDVMLKAGTYTVTWRSTDPNWQAPSGKTTVQVGVYDYAYVESRFTYIPQVVVDVMTYENGECTLSSAGGTATMNPKDGLVPVGKAITLTAKAAKGYVFQGWGFAKFWEYGNSPYNETAATWKAENQYAYEIGPGWCSPTSRTLFNMSIDPGDLKVHIVAVFKALADYSADDIEFSGFSAGNGDYPVVDDAVTVRAVVGCAVEYSLCSAPAASPLSYKLQGKLPDGLKFDGKTGVLSGVPKKAGETMVTIVASDPAKNSKSLSVEISVAELPSWLVGEYRGAMSDGYDEYDSEIGWHYVPGPMNGVLELTVKSDGKVSAKVLTSAGSRSVSGSLEWNDPEIADGSGTDEKPEFRFWHTDKDESYCHVNFSSDGTIEGEVDSYYKAEDEYFGGEMSGFRRDTELLAGAGFLDKYYTFAFCQEKVEEVPEPGEEEPVESEMKSGYGYLTVKTDKNGSAKVTGQLPDGEKVSMSALVMPEISFGYPDIGAAEVGAKLFLFASPSAYKKLGWFAMIMALNPDGSVSFDENSFWTVDGYDDGDPHMYGEGALYSEAKTLEHFYWTVSCDYNTKLITQYSYKAMSVDEYTGKTYSWTEYGFEFAKNFEGLFYVAVKGDSKGAISLVEKSPAPWEESWKEDGVTYKEWNYWEDRNGKEITDPSQLSISFAKATGIFTGKANAYFDYDVPSYKQNSRTKEIEESYVKKHTTASLPYAGVMIADGDGGYYGLGSAVYSLKYTYLDSSDRAKTGTMKVTLPVSIYPDND